MSLRQVVVWVGFLFVPFFSNGQGKKKFSLPEDVTTRDVESGQVWVKLKQANKYALEGHTGGRFSPKVQALSIEPFLTKQSRSSPKGRVSPRKQLVDISLYYKLKFDKTEDVEEYINDLYATGLFEIVEPVYRAKPQLVPNDPSLSQQYYIDLIKAPQAWDLVDVDESIVIGIVDTGGDLDHPDLQPNLFIDPAEPIDGIDNDNDGYVDNNRGWDFSGSTLAQIGTPGFKGDNDPSINQGGLFSHGTMVAGCASASTNNGIGIAGVGFSAKLMFTKHYADDQAPGDYSSNLYDGILYAATHGAKIINCSWGSYNPSTIAQDIITYVTHDLNCVVVAAAGNSNLETPIYPASYDYVVSVAYSSSSDVRSAYSNYGKTIDIIAPGEGIYTTSYNDGYGSDSGTSLATPMVSGTAALVWSKFPTLNALQVAEQIRVSADESVYANNPAYLYKLGKGRLDVERALTIQTPSIRASNQLLVKGNGSTPDPGDVASLYFDFTNYLETSSGALKVTLTSSSPYITVDHPVFDLGSMTANTTIRNTSSPFVVTISETLPLDSPIEALLTFEDGDYKDFQLVNISVPSYIDVNENNIITSITPAGRIGFGNTELQSNGSGFIYNEESILYEMGLIMGTSAGDIDNNLRTTVGAYDQDFSPSSKITKHTPGERSYSEITGGFINAADASSATLSVEYTSLVWKNDPYRNFVILEYKIRNTSAAPINNFHFGIFADWDISNGGAADRASWDDDTRLGYVYGAQGTGKPHAGIQVLSGNEHYNAIDNDPAIAGNPFGIYDGFTDNEKFTIISNGLARLEAGNATTGNDVSHAVASGPYSINSGDEITVAFAIHAALTKDELIKSAKYADSLYNYTFNAPRPVVEPVAACYGSEATVTASGAASFNWYKEPTGGSPFFTGSQFVTSSIFNDTVFFVSNADHPFESIRTPATIEVKPVPEIEVSGDVEFCEGTTVTLTASQADAYNWSSGETTRAIEVGSAGNYSVATNNNGSECKSAETVTVIVFPQPSSTFTVSPENPEAGKSVSFSNTGGGGTSWNWEFGDGDVSTEQNPVHVYDELGDYTVTLTTSSAAGCESTSSTLIGIITGVEQRAGQSFTIYPNPVSDNKVIVRFTSRQGDLDVSMFNAQGTIVYFSKVDNDLLSVDVSHFADGIYMMMFRTPVETFAKKIIVRR